MTTHQHTREQSGLRLDRHLRWWHDGEPILHPNIIETFNRGLKVASDGRYRLEVGADWCIVEVEGPGYQVTAVDVTGDQVSLRLSDRTAEWLDVATLSLDGEDRLEARVKNGQARAVFSRDAQFQFATHLEATSSGYALRLGGEALPVPRLSPRA